MALQGGGVVLGVEAVVRRYPLQAAERGLAAPRLGQPVAALEALDALEGVLAAKLTWEPKGIFFFLKNITFLQCPLKSHPPPKKKEATNVPCQSSTLFRGASSNSIAHLISLLQPPFGFDFKWKMITQIAIAIFDLGKDKRSLSMASHYRVTDNAAPP